MPTLEMNLTIEDIEEAARQTLSSPTLVSPSSTTLRRCRRNNGRYPNKEFKIVIGSTFGDEGKGATVQWLCKKALAEGKKPVVIRYSGGPQAGHTVINNGVKHVCSSFGSGVLLGVPTLYDNVFIDPICLQNERWSLLSKGISKVKTPGIYTWNDIVMITPYDVLYNQQDSKTLSDGTCGKGINATKERYDAGMYSSDPEENLKQAATYYELKKNFTIKLSQELTDKYIRAAKWYQRTKWGASLSDYDVIIYEGSQGLLLDSDYGFNPYTTPSRVGLNGISKYLFDENLEVYLVTRTYTTRHGNGYDPKFPIIIPSTKDETNVENEFQGKFKTGLLELDLLKRAFDRHNLANICKKHGLSPRLVVTHTDLIDDGTITSFMDGDKKVEFSSTKDALGILINQLDDYLPFEKVYYSDNPNSEFKEFV